MSFLWGQINAITFLNSSADSTINANSLFFFNIKMLPAATVDHGIKDEISWASTDINNSSDI